MKGKKIGEAQRKRRQKPAPEADRLDHIKDRIEAIRQQYKAWEAVTLSGPAIEALRAWEAMNGAQFELYHHLGALSRLDPERKIVSEAEAEALYLKVYNGVQTVEARQAILGPIRHLSVELASLIEATIEGTSGAGEAVAKMQSIAAALKKFAEPSPLEFSPHPQEPEYWSYIRCDLGPIFNEALTTVRMLVASPHWDGGSQLEQLRDEILRRLVAWEKGESTKPQKQDSADRTHEAPLYVEIDLAARTLTVGSDFTLTPSGKVWDFLRALADAKRYSLPDPKAKEWKNARDMLRLKIGKEKLPFVVETTSQGCKLAPNVKLKGGGQIGIRRAR